MFRKWYCFRDAELFLFGCNVALRVSDLLKLKFSDIQRTEQGAFIELVETKTGKNKKLALNDVAMGCVDRLFNMSDYKEYLFEAQSRNVKTSKPVTRGHVSNQFKKVSEALNLDYTLNTHSMRKTFGYHAYTAGVDINVLQKLFKHSSSETTLRYIGITQESVNDVYLNFSLS